MTWLVVNNGWFMVKFCYKTHQISNCRKNTRIWLVPNWDKQFAIRHNPMWPQEKLMEKDTQLCADQTKITQIQNIKSTCYVLGYVTWSPSVKSGIPGVSIVLPHIFPSLYCANERWAELWAVVQRNSQKHVKIVELKLKGSLLFCNHDALRGDEMLVFPLVPVGALSGWGAL